MACHILKRTQANSLYLFENNLIACRSLDSICWQRRDTNPRPAELASQPGSLHCSSKSLSPLSDVGRSLDRVIFVFEVDEFLEANFHTFFLYLAHSLFDIVCHYRRCAKAALDDLISWLRNGGEVAVSLLLIITVFIFFVAAK